LLARAGKLPCDNPIMQITSYRPTGSIEHSKTDVFLERLESVGAFGERIKAAMAVNNAAESIRLLQEIESEVAGPASEVPQVYSVLLGVYLGYRDKKAYAEMVSLFEKMPRDLRQTPVAIEQCALALNRLAEAAAKDGRADAADEIRDRAFKLLDRIPKDGVTSETWGIRGRIYKGWNDALLPAEGVVDLARSRRAESMLSHVQRAPAMSVRTSP
jgi:hypothetical protein